jgi:hypothetical protein
LTSTKDYNCILSVMCVLHTTRSIHLIKVNITVEGYSFRMEQHVYMFTTVACVSYEKKA